MIRHWLAMIVLSLSMSFAGYSSEQEVLMVDNIPVVITGEERDAPWPTGDFNTLVIPIKRAANLILIEAEVEGQQGNFILDFGAPYLVLNETYFRDFRNDYTARVGSASGEGSYAKRKVAEQLSFHGIDYTEVDADVTPLGHIEDSRGIKILGLLGVNLFLEFEVELDVARDVMYLYRLDEEGNRLEEKRPATPMLTEVDLEVDNNVIFLWGTVAGKQLLFNLDTAAETVVLTNTIPGKVKRTLKIEDRTYMKGANGQTVPVFRGRMQSMEIGGQSFNNMRVIMTNLSSMSKAYGRTISGMLGYDFLAQGIVSINLKTEKLRVYSYFTNG